MADPLRDICSSVLRLVGLSLSVLNTCSDPVCARLERAPSFFVILFGGWGREQHFTTTPLEKRGVCVCIHVVVHYAWAVSEVGVRLTRITIFDELVLVADGSRWLCRSHDIR